MFVCVCMCVRVCVHVCEGVCAYEDVFGCAVHLVAFVCEDVCGECG